MAEDKSTSRKLEPHPLLVKLLSKSGGTDAHVFRGYVGPSSAKGRVRLYPSLGDLTFSIEVAEEDILDSAAAPERLLPYGGTVIWVKSDAEVVFHGEQVTTQAVRSLGRSERGTVSEVTPARPGRFVEVRRGRLHIRVRPGSWDTCASCSCASCGPCKLCSSTCKSDLPVRPMVVER